MGVDSTALPLPTPTDTTESIAAPSESESEGSRIRQSYTLQDGSPVTIRTRGNSHHRHAKSQTSLLIEYFEGSAAPANNNNKSTTRQPDLRVRLIPPKRPRRNSSGDISSSTSHIEVSETRSRKASNSRRGGSTGGGAPVTLSSSSPPPLQKTTELNLDTDDDDNDDGKSMNSYASATEESAVSRNYPIEIEIDRSGYGRGRATTRRPTSPLIPQIPHPTESNLSFRPDASEISDIPADSFLDDDHRKSELTLDSHVPAALFMGGSSVTGGGASTMDRRDRSVASASEYDRLSSSKVRDRDRRDSSKPRPAKNQSRVRKTSSEVRTESSNTSRRRTSRGGYHHDSVVSAADTARSYDQAAASAVSGTSRTSINNPKLLETVEDAIRRLILPELSALKREQSKRESRRGSIASTTTASRDEDVRKGGGGRGESAHEGVRKKERRNRDAARHAYGDNSPFDAADSQSESVMADDNDTIASSSRARGSVGGGGGALLDDRDRRQRRRRRAEHARSQSVGGPDTSSVADDYDDQSYMSPPMPLASDINASEVTRASLMSVAESDRPLSAAAERDPQTNAAPLLPRLNLPSLNLGDTSRGEDDAASASSDMSTPTQARASPFGFPYNIATRHPNISHGDLTTLARRRTGELEGATARRQAAAMREGRVLEEEEDEYEDEIAEYGEEDEDEDEYGYAQYPQDAYGYQQHVLSPIPSEAEGSEVSSRHNSQVSRSGAYSPTRSYRSETSSIAQALAPPSMAASAAHSNANNLLAVGGGGFNAAKESEVGARSTYAAEDSEVGQKPVNNKVQAMARMVNVPFGVESAVASLVDGSVATESNVGYNNHNRNNSPNTKSYNNNNNNSSPNNNNKNYNNNNNYSYSRSSTPSALSVDSRHGFDEEYEPDDYGYKKRYQPSPLQTNRSAPSDTEAAITAGAVAALRAKQQQDKGAGVNRAFSFQQRGNEETLSMRRDDDDDDDDDDNDDDGRRTPRMNASGVPDWQDPLPKAEHVRHTLVDCEWGDGRRTPTQQRTVGDALTAEAISRVPGGTDDRTDEDRKRDTLVTNPYEDTSPNPALANIRMAAAYGGYGAGSPGLHANKLLDEGYMSQGQGGTPPQYLRGLSAQGNTPTHTPGPDGGDLEGIESRDIVSLMQFLMARDAKKDVNEGALVQALIQTAVEMQNSFTDMKKLLVQTRDEINENTDRTVFKAINGPRPYPGGPPRAITAPIGSDELKKQGIFKRALKGLGNKGSGDLGRIEDMFNQLLCEVDVLKTQGQSAANTAAHPSVESVHDEPEGFVGNNNNNNNSSRNPSNASGIRLGSPGTSNAPTKFERKYSDLRISTVPEGNEEPVSRRNTTPGNNTSVGPLTNNNNNNNVNHSRGNNSGPIGSPIDMTSPVDPKSRKSKTNSWFPKISRWSESTSSSMQRVFRSSATPKHAAKGSQEWRPRQPSRSESSLHDQTYDESDLSDDDTDGGDSQQVHSVIDPYGDDSLPLTEYAEGGGAPITTSPQRGHIMTPEDPKYKAHRNSLNLQHPQPRAGQTERFRTALEYSAQDFMPSSPRSEQWGGSMTSINRLPPNQNQIRYVETQLQPLATEPNWRAASPGPFSNHHHQPQGQGQGGGGGQGVLLPPRPPKEPMDDLPPPRRRQKDYTGSPKMLQQQQQQQQMVLQNRNLSNALNGGPARRPSGPRAMTPKLEDEEKRKRNTFGALVGQEERY